MQYVFFYNKEKRVNIINALEGIAPTKVLRFTKRKELNRWLEKIESKKGCQEEKINIQ